MKQGASSLQDFWALTVEVWNTGFMGMSVGQVLTALAIVLLALLLRGVLAGSLIRLLRAWTRRFPGETGDKILAALDEPIRFVPVVLGIFLAGEVLTLDPATTAFVGIVVRSLIAFIIFWAAYRIMGPLGSILQKLERIVTIEVVEWATKAIRWLIVFIGAATILELWGIQVGPILAGLGLFGVAVALGAQDLFKNLIAGVMILMERRFREGDWVRVDGVVEGTVKSIGFRSTVVRRFDKAPVYVPNAKFADTAVTNFSEMTHRRIFWKIGIEYRASIDQLRQVRDALEGYVLGSAEYAHPPEVATFVRIDAFSDSSIDIMLYCFTKTTNWGEWLEIKERLAYRIIEIVEDAGCGFAFPSQSIYVESLPEGRPEVFVPPGTDGSVQVADA